MDPFLLPSAGCLQNINQDLIHDFSENVNIINKKVLAIGYSGSEIETFIGQYSPNSIKILTLWESHKDACDQKHPLFFGDISKKTPFDDNEFDVIMTLSLFEHILDLPGALKEIRRILSPNGYLLIHYGPVWTSAVGHHLYSQAGDDFLDFTRGQIPAHIHLLCSADEIKNFYLSKGYSEAQIQSVLFWFNGTDIINRLPFETYIQQFTIFFSVVCSSLMYHDLPYEHIDTLRCRYPHISDFSTYGGNFLLKNRKQ